MSAFTIQISSGSASCEKQFTLNKQPCPMPTSAASWTVEEQVTGIIGGHANASMSSAVVGVFDVYAIDTVGFGGTNLVRFRTTLNNTTDNDCTYRITAAGNSTFAGGGNPYTDIWEPIFIDQYISLGVTEAFSVSWERTVAAHSSYDLYIHCLAVCDIPIGSSASLVGTITLESI